MTSRVNVQIGDDSPLAAILNERHPRKVDAAEWARTHLDDEHLSARDERCEFWTEGWATLADAGMLGLLVDPEFGGRGLDLCTALLTIEGLGLGCRDDGLVFGLSSQVLTMQLTLERFGSHEQRESWLPGLVAGEQFGAFCMSEPESGSDAFSLSTTADATDDGYEITGEKAWVTFGPIADVFIVFASTDRSKGQWGITAFVVPATTPGCEIGPNRPKMGLRTTPFANVTFDRCVVADSARLGSVGAGASIFSSAMEAERAFLLVASLGSLERTLDDAVDHASDRHQFGRPIGAFQGVQHALAEVKCELEAARTLLYKSAALHQLGHSSMLAAAIAKLAASEAALHGALAAAQVHGARGYVTEFGVERDVRNAVGGVVYGGTSLIQKNIIARLLGLPGGNE